MIGCKMGFSLVRVYIVEKIISMENFGENDMDANMVTLFARGIL